MAKSCLAIKPNLNLAICNEAAISIPPNVKKPSLSITKLESHYLRPEPPFQQNMGFAKAYEMDLPPPNKPPIPKLSSVILPSTCDSPECQHRHRPCFYTGMPKPWYDD